MARIAGVPAERAGLLVRLAYRFARRRLGHVPGPLAVAAHDSQILFAVGGYELMLERARQLPQGLKALAGIKAASLIGCVF